MQVSPNEKIVAYALSKCGSDWTEWKFRHLLNNKLLTDTIRGTRGCDGIVWSPDCKGFFYSYFSRQSEKFDPLAPISSAEIRFHRLGTKQSQDETVYRTGSPSMPSITCIGDFLLIDCEQAPGRHVLIKSLERSDSPVLDMFSSSSESFNFAGEMKNGNLLFSTDHDAPHYKFVSVNPKEFLSGKLSLHTEFEHKSATILSWVTFPERLVLHLMRDGRSYVEDYDWHGKLISRLNLPTDCDIELQAGDDECFIEVSNIVTPPTQYRYDMKSRKLSTIYRAQFPACDLSQYRMEQVSYKSRDGVTVSMYIAYKKGINLQSGKNPVLMEGYGGFREWQMPGFSNRALVWMDMGGIFCVPQIRGGIENGADWHRTATKVNKQRSFDDFIAAAEWLIEKRYTCPTRLAITGASNGGLLVAACITQRPELFGAACVDSGILDMVRFNRFGAGATFTEEYGSPDKKDEFDALYAYSPLHRVQPQTKYPATLIIARGSDDRVAPIHSYKFAAALQSSQS
ncbi:MAG: prolyl oligopeptidase family serine peptidase, partial [Cyanobacteria bacterium]|nr:prolyl oligopeptidase family serine peptidase [Cyanobacteriota bacterium]